MPGVIAEDKTIDQLIEDLSDNDFADASASDLKERNAALVQEISRAFRGVINDHLAVAERVLQEQLTVAGQALAKNHCRVADALTEQVSAKAVEVLYSRRGGSSDNEWGTAASRSWSTPGSMPATSESHSDLFQAGQRFLQSPTAMGKRNSMKQTAFVPVPGMLKANLQPPSLTLPEKKEESELTPRVMAEEESDASTLQAEELPVSVLAKEESDASVPQVGTVLSARIEAVQRAKTVTISLPGSAEDEQETSKALSSPRQDSQDQETEPLDRSLRSAAKLQIQSSEPDCQSEGNGNLGHDLKKQGTADQSDGIMRLVTPQTETKRSISGNTCSPVNRIPPSAMRLSRARTNVVKTVFADSESMKEAVRQAIGQKEYNVAHYYKQEGMLSFIAQHAFFEQATLAVIALNAIWIGIDADHNHAKTLLDAHIAFRIAENMFCAYFLVEILVRAGAFEKWQYMLKDGWFAFDSALAVTMVFETWVMTSVLYFSSSGSSAADFGNATLLKLLRMMRLSRMARMMRLMRAIPELMILIKGMAVATRSVFFTLCLLMIFMYVFGVAFTQLTRNTFIGTSYFNNVPQAMNTLLLHGTLLEDCPDVINAIGDEHILLRLLFLVYVLLASLTVMNMLVGVLVEVVSVVSAVEKETLQVNFVKQKLQQTVDDFKLDADNNGSISKAEFELLLQTPDAARALSDVGVDVIGLVDYTDYLFKEKDEFNFAGFIDIVLSLRGSNTATVKDIVDLRKFFLQEFHHVEQCLSGANLYQTHQGDNPLKRALTLKRQRTVHGNAAR